MLVLEDSWKPLPAAGTDAESAVETIVAGFALTDSLAAALTLAISRASDYANALAPGERRSFALIGDPLLARVDAVLSVRLSRVASDAYEQYLALAQGATEANPAVEVIDRTLLEVDLPAGRAIASHDFTLNRHEDGVPQPALERALVALFIGDAPALIEFSLAAQDLTVFEDMTGYLLGVVSKFRTTEHEANGEATA